MMVIPVMVTVTPRELETIGTLTIWNTGEEGVNAPDDATEEEWLKAEIFTRYEVTWSDEHGTIKDDVWHNPADGAMPLLAMATAKLKRGPKV